MRNDVIDLDLLTLHHAPTVGAAPTIARDDGLAHGTGEDAACVELRAPCLAHHRGGLDALASCKPLCERQTLCRGARGADRAARRVALVVLDGVLWDGDLHGGSPVMRFSALQEKHYARLSRIARVNER